MSDLNQLIRTSLQSPEPPSALAPWSEIERRAAAARPRRRRRYALAMGVVGVVVACVIVLGGRLGGDGPTPLARASTAVASWPAHHILHLRMLTEYRFPQADSVQETWPFTSAPFTLRTQVAFPATGMGTKIVQTVVSASGEAATYDPRSHEVVSTTNASHIAAGIDQSVRTSIRELAHSALWEKLGPSVKDGHHVLGYADGRGRIYVDSENLPPDRRDELRLRNRR